MTLASREAIEAAYRIHYGVGCSFLETQQIIEAAYAIDVAPLLAWVEELEALPKLKDCLFHRCSKHYKVQQLNANEPCGSECGACVGEELTVERDRLKEENASLKTFLSAAFQEGEETRKRL